MHDKGEGPTLTVDQRRHAWFSQPRSGITKCAESRTNPLVQGRGQSDPFSASFREEEEEKEEEEKGKVVEVLDSKADFKVFNRSESLKVPTGDFSHLPSA